MIENGMSLKYNCIELFNLNIFFFSQMQPHIKKDFICYTFKRKDCVLQSFLKEFNFKLRLSDSDKIDLFDKMLLWA